MGATVTGEFYSLVAEKLRPYLGTETKYHPGGFIAKGATAEDIVTKGGALWTPNMFLKWWNGKRKSLF